MERPNDMPAALDLEGTTLQRLRFDEPRREEDEVATTASYDARPRGDSPIRVRVTARAAADLAEDLSEATAEIYAAFELVELDAELHEQLLEEQEVEIVRDVDPPPDEDREVRFEVSLREPSAEAASGHVLAFRIDPPIGRWDPPHRWVPDSAATTWAWLRLGGGSATMRLFRGDEATDRWRRQDGAGRTSGLHANVTTPRVRVNGHENGTTYVVEGGWHRP